MPYGWYGGPFFWVMFAFMIVFWVAVVIGIIALIRWSVASTKRPAEPDRALIVLRERYARGEISKEDYERMIKELSH